MDFWLIGSVRSYLRTALPPGTVELLVAAAQSASTSSNKQFWSVIAVQDAARKQRLARLCANQTWMAEAPLVLVWLADLSRLTRMAEHRGVTLEGLSYLESFLVAVIDTALAAQNAAVAAEAMGLGIVYIGAMRDRPLDIASELGLPPRCFAAIRHVHRLPRSQHAYRRETAPAASGRPPPEQYSHDHAPEAVRR